ncbi:MAG: hypothetical protein NVS9B1_19040 [Candidatus Dormibacteraceae bacterium]
MAEQPFSALTEGDPSLLGQVEKLVVEGHHRWHRSRRRPWSRPDAYRWLRYEDPDPLARLIDGARRLAAEGVVLEGAELNAALAIARRHGFGGTHLETSLILLVPGANPLVGPLREAHDPVALLGVQAHLTLVYPFLRSSEIGAAVEDDLTLLFDALPPIEVTFTRTARFQSSVVYLAPEPAAPIVRITRAIAERYPEAPLYGGRFNNIVPHLTLGHAENDETATAIESAAARFLPIQARLTEVALMVEGEDRAWRQRRAFPLRGSA